MKWRKWLGMETFSQTIRSTDPELARAFGLGVLPGGQIVSPFMAENLSTVLACVNAIGSNLAALPVWVYRWQGKGRTVVEDHPVARMVREGPNAHQSWPDFVEWLVASILLRGNGLAEIREEAGRLRLVPHQWASTSVQMLPNGRLAYDVAELVSIYGGRSRSYRLLEGEVLHVRDRSDDGVIGRSRLQRAAEVLGEASGSQRVASAAWRNNARPGGILSFPNKLSDEQMKRNQAAWERGYSGENAGRTAVLDGGVTWSATDQKLIDAQLLESRRFSGEELARLFGVPPAIIGDLSHGTFTNSETLIRYFAQSTLSAWCTKIEAAFRKQVMTESERAEGYHIELDLSGLLRGDPETRWKNHAIARQHEILSVDEIREQEGWDPRGDDAEASEGQETG